MSNIMEFGEVPPPQIWIATGSLRQAVPEGTTSDFPKLQQLWIDRNSGERQWRAIPRVVVSNAEFFGT